MVLGAGPDSTGNPNWSMMSIDGGTGNFAPQSDYYAMGHASKFVQPGAYRIDSNTFDNSIEDVAFKNPDGSIVVVVANISGSCRLSRCLWNGQLFSYQMPGSSVATFKWVP